MEHGTYFTIHMIYKLPDDFEGTVADALRAAADYCERSPNTYDPDAPKFDFPESWADNADLSARFAEYRRRGGRDFVATESINRLSEDGWARVGKPLPIDSANAGAEGASE